MPKKRKIEKPEPICAARPIERAGCIHPTLTDGILHIDLSTDVIDAIRSGAGEVVVTVRKQDLCVCHTPDSICIPIQAAMRVRIPVPSVLQEDVHERR